MGESTNRIESTPAAAAAAAASFSIPHFWIVRTSFGTTGIHVPSTSGARKCLLAKSGSHD